MIKKLLINPMPPIRSPRRLYLISTITVNKDDNPTGTDSPTGGTTRPIILKMKESVGDYLNLTPLLSSDPIFLGTFGGAGLNLGTKFERNVGGFKQAAYKLVAKTKFTITEKYYNDQDTFVTANKDFKTISIGFPKGHSVHEVKTWLLASSKISNMRAFITPAGRRVDLYTA